MADRVLAACPCRNLAGDTRHDPTQTRVALEAGFHGLFIAPLRTQGRTIDALSVYTKRPLRFRPDEISLVSAFADQASLAIEKGRLLQQAEDGRQVLDRLYRVAIRIQTSTDRDRRLHAFIEGAHEVLGFDRVYVFLLTPDGSSLELVTTHGEHGVAPARLPLSPAAGAFYEAFVSRRAVVVLSDDDLRRVLPVDPAYEKHPYFRTKRFVMVPLVFGDHAIGVVCADNKGSRRPIAPASVEPFTLVCQHLASSLENSRLYHKADQRRREAEVVAELARDMNGSLELDAMLQRVAEGARELCGSDMAMIALRDPDSAAMVVRCRAGSRTDTYKDRRIEPGKGVGGQVLLTGGPFRADNYAEDSRITKDYLQWAPTDASIASLAVPIRAGERIEGLLYVQNRAPRPFSDRDEVTLVRHAEHAAIAVENVRLFAAERAARGDAEATATALRAREEQYRALAEGSIQGLTSTRTPSSGSSIPRWRRSSATGAPTNSSSGTTGSSLPRTSPPGSSGIVRLACGARPCRPAMRCWACGTTARRSGSRCWSRSCRGRGSPLSSERSSTSRNASAQKMRRTPFTLAAALIIALVGISPALS